MFRIISILIFVLTSVGVHAAVEKEDRLSILAHAGYKDAIRVIKTSDGKISREAAIVLSFDGDLRMVEDIYAAVDNRRENETLIAKNIKEMGIVSDRLIVVDRTGAISFVEPKGYSAADFGSDLLGTSAGAYIIQPWNLLAAHAAFVCAASSELLVFAAVTCAQLAIAGRVYLNMAKNVPPRAARLSSAEKISSGGMVSSSATVQRSKDGRIEELLLNLDGDKYPLSKLRETERSCDSVLVPLVSYRYEILNP